MTTEPRHPFKSEPPKQTTWKQISTVGVDSGRVHIADPYSYGHNMPDDVQWLNEGEGVTVRTWYGDGCYPVMAELDEDGDVMRLVIDFTVDECQGESITSEAGIYLPATNDPEYRRIIQELKQ